MLFCQIPLEFLPDYVYRRSLKRELFLLKVATTGPNQLWIKVNKDVF